MNWDSPLCGRVGHRLKPFCSYSRALPLQMCPHEGSVPLQPITAQQQTLTTTFQKVSKCPQLQVRAVTLKGVKFYFKVQELPYSHQAFLTDTGLIRPAPVAALVYCLSPTSPTVKATAHPKSVHRALPLHCMLIHPLPLRGFQHLQFLAAWKIVVLLLLLN